MAVAMSKTREQFPLSTKKVLKKTITGTLIWVIVFLFVYIIAMFMLSLSLGSWIGTATIIIFGLLALIVVTTYLYQLWYYNVYFYDLNPDYVVIKKGPITPKEITIPYERIQDVYVDQDLLDRFFGLYDVHLSSATATSGLHAHIDGVEKPAADGLRIALLKIVGEKISKNKPPEPSKQVSKS